MSLLSGQCTARPHSPRDDWAKCLPQVSLLSGRGCEDLVHKFAKHLSASLQALIAAACKRHGKGHAQH